MTWQGALQLTLVLAVVVALVQPGGDYIDRVMRDQPTPLRPLLRPLERLLYWLAGVDPAVEQGWVGYAQSLVAFNLAGMLVLYGLQRLQHALPLNPQALGPVAPDLALNTAVSFTTNTSWQSYAGEQTLSNLSQMAGITVQSFLSCATGVAVALALVRGFARRSAATIGNFWTDLTRVTLYLLLPVCAVAALFLVWQGVPQTLGGFVDATGLEGAKQVIARGPVASQEAIKLLSGDGGGFFNANSAHPFENPTALSGLGQIVLILLFGAALTGTFGRMVGDRRQGWALFGVMAALFLVGLAVMIGSEAHANPGLAPFGVDGAATALQAGGNMEGKEVRFGVAQSALYAVATTASSDGAVEAMFDSFMPLGGLVALVNMMLDEVIIGGPGSGLFGMLLFAIVAVFVAGLMIGRTPEYLGKKIDAAEVKMTMLALLVLPAAVLICAAVAAVTPAALAGLGNDGPHGFSEILYAYSSAAATNGSALAGLAANSPFYNLTLALVMFACRFAVIVPVLCIAGLLAAKRSVPAGAGTLPTTGPLFMALLGGVIVVVGGLTFFPALALGPVEEHLLLFP